MGIGDHFLNITAVAQTLRTTLNKWDFLKLRSFCKANGIVNKTKQQPIEWEKIFNKPISDIRLVSKIYKKIQEIRHKNSEKPN